MWGIPHRQILLKTAWSHKKISIKKEMHHYIIPVFKSEVSDFRPHWPAFRNLVLPVAYYLDQVYNSGLAGKYAVHWSPNPGVWHYNLHYHFKCRHCCQFTRSGMVPERYYYLKRIKIKTGSRFYVWPMLMWKIGFRQISRN